MAGPIMNEQAVVDFAALPVSPAGCACGGVEVATTSRQGYAKG